MDVLLPTDWSEIFIPQAPLLEIFIRGTIVYLFLFFLLRIVMKREAAGLGISDLLVVVLLADAAQNAMANDYTSILDGLLLVSVIIGWDWGLNYLAYRLPFLREYIHPRPILIIRDGELLEKAMRHELLTHEEILGNLRGQGIERVEDVKRAYMESDGTITAIPRQNGGPRKRHDQKKKLFR